MPERDPRIDPRPGDVLVNGTRTRYVLDLFHTEVTMTPWVFAVDTSTDNPLHGELMGPFYHQWRKWARNAEVIHAAD